MLCFAWTINLQTQTKVPGESGTKSTLYIEKFEHVKINNYSIRVLIHSIWVEIPMSNVASFWWQK